VPFQILAAGMLFRTSSKMADSLTRATGAVFRRAWRQILYAAMVLLGAWAGQHWGIGGVAWGVLLAITVNFLMMAQLSLEEARMSWWRLWLAHVPAVLSTLVTAPLVWLLASGLRSWGMPPVVTLASGLGLVAGGFIALTLLAPSAFLGPDGRWMIDTLRGYVRKVTGGRESHVASPGEGQTPQAATSD
jgi:PST family polysaccharide transporter